MHGLYDDLLLSCGSKVKLRCSNNGKVSLNLNKMMANKTDTVGKLTSGIAGLFKKNKVDHFFGEAKFVNNKTIEANQKKFKADKILIATGSVPSTIPVSYTHLTLPTISDV